MCKPRVSISLILTRLLAHRADTLYTASSGFFFVHLTMLCIIFKSLNLPPFSGADVHGRASFRCHPQHASSQPIASLLQNSYRYQQHRRPVFPPSPIRLTAVQRKHTRSHSSTRSHAHTQCFRIHLPSPGGASGRLTPANTPSAPVYLLLPAISRAWPRVACK